MCTNKPTYDQEPYYKIYKPTNNNLRTSSNTGRANQDNSPRINRGTGYENQRVVNVAGASENIAYHKEKMLLCKQEEAGVQLNAEQADWKDDTADEPNDLELEAHYIEHNDQDDTNDIVKERDLLASLIEKLKCEINDSKNQANNELSKTNQLMFKDLKKFQAELNRYHDVNYASKVAIDCAKAKGDLMLYKIESEKSFNEYT
ncbi:hypothetical protein Tco_1344777 [Tanacetum coccineum]